MPPAAVYLVKPFLNRLDGRTFDVVRGIEIRLAGAKADHVDALGLHRFGLRL